MEIWREAIAIGDVLRDINIRLSHLYRISRHPILSKGEHTVIQRKYMYRIKCDKINFEMN